MYKNIYCFIYIALRACVYVKTERSQSFKYVKYMVTYTEASHLPFCTKERSLRHPRHIWAIIRAAQLEKRWGKSALLPWRTSLSGLMRAPAFSHCLLHCHNSVHSSFIRTSFTSVLCSQTTQLLSHRKIISNSILTNFPEWAERALERLGEKKLGFRVSQKDLREKSSKE